jgi:hypothetical protein
MVYKVITFVLCMPMVTFLLGHFAVWTKGGMPFTIPSFTGTEVVLDGSLKSGLHADLPTGCSSTWLRLETPPTEWGSAMVRNQNGEAFIYQLWLAKRQRSSSVSAVLLLPSDWTAISISSVPSATAQIACVTRP